MDRKYLIIRHQFSIFFVFELTFELIILFHCHDAVSSVTDRYMYAARRNLCQLILHQGSLSEHAEKKTQQQPASVSLPANDHYRRACQARHLPERAAH